MSHFERRSHEGILSQKFDDLEQSESSFSTILAINEPSYAEPPQSSFLPHDHPQILCLNSITQSKYNLSPHQTVTCNDPLLAQNLAVDIAKAQLFDDPEMMHQKLIKLHTVHTNLQCDLERIVANLSTIPTFHTRRRRVIQTWFRKSRPMIFGSLAGLILCLTCATMLYIVVKLKLLLHLFGR